MQNWNTGLGGAMVKILVWMQLSEPSISIVIS